MTDEWEEDRSHNQTIEDKSHDQSIQDRSRDQTIFIIGHNY